jgi:hypothetical protein
MHHFLVKMQDHVLCFMISSKKKKKSHKKKCSLFYAKIVQTHSKNQLTQTDSAEMNFLI